MKTQTSDKTQVQKRWFLRAWRTIAYISLLLLLWLGAGFQSVNAVRGQEKDRYFLQLGLSAPSLGVGGSYPSYTSGVNALYSNPACLGLFHQREISTTFGLLESNVGHFSLGYAQRYFGFSAVLPTDTTLKDIGYLRFNRQKIFPRVGMFAGALATPIGSHLAAGIKVRYLTDFTDLDKTSQTNADIGFIFKVRKVFGFGVAIDNLTDSSNREIKLGSHLNFRNISILTSVIEPNLNSSSIEDIFHALHIGAELRLEVITLRGGVYGELDSFQDFDFLSKTFGVGLGKVPLRIDYAYLQKPSKEVFHRFSITTNFDKPRPKPIYKPTPKPVDIDAQTLSDAFQLRFNRKVYDSVNYNKNDRADWWKIEVPKKGRLYVKLDWDSSSENLELALYNGSNTKIAISNKYVGSREEISEYISVPGAYYLKVYPHGSGDSSTYTLETSFTLPSESPHPLVLNGGKGHNRVDFDLGNPTDWWKLKIANEGKLDLKLEWADSKQDLYLALYKSDRRTKLASSAQSNTSEEKLSSVNISEPGTYYAKVSAYKAGIAADYTLSSSFIVNEPTHLLSVNGRGRNRVDNASGNKIDWWKLEIPNKGTLELRLLWEDSSADLDLGLYKNGKSAHCLKESAQGNTTKEMISIEIPKAGAYYAQVLAYSTKNSTRYTLTSSFIQPPEFHSLPLNSSEGDRVDYDEGNRVDWWKLSITKPGSLELTLKWTTSNANLGLAIFREDKVTKLRESNKISARQKELFYEIKQGGMYYALVSAYREGDAASYTLTSNFRQSPQISTLSLNQSVNGSLDYSAGNDIDLWQLYISQKGSLELSLQCKSTTANLDMGLYKRNQTTLVKSGHGSGARKSLSVDINNADTYYVKVNTNQGRDAVNYTLTSKFMPKQRSETFNLGLNESGRGRVDYNAGNQVDWWRLSIPRRGKLKKISLSWNKSSADLDLKLYREDKTAELADSTKSSGSSETISKEIGPGIYYVKVYAYEAGDAADYTLRASVQTISSLPPRIPKTEPKQLSPEEHILSLNGSGTNRVDFNAGNKVDLWKLSISKPGVLTLKLTWNDKREDLDLKLLKSDKRTEIASSTKSNTNTESISKDITTPGNYYARVYAYKNGDASNYTISSQFIVERRKLLRPDRINVNEKASGNSRLSSGSYEEWKVTLRTGGILEVELPKGYVGQVFRDNSLRDLVSKTREVSNRKKWFATISSSGTYIIKVKNNSGPTDYDIEAFLYREYSE